MRTTAFLAMAVSVYMIIYGWIQLFSIDPDIVRSIYNPYEFDPSSHVFISILVTFLVMSFVWLFAIWKKEGFRTQMSMKPAKLRQKDLVQPPGKGAFEIFMLSSLIFSALGTFKHDVVLYGAGVLIFILPVFLDPYVQSRSIQQPPQSRIGINWEMISALIALIALILSLLIHYGLIP